MPGTHTHTPHADDNQSLTSRVQIQATRAPHKMIMLLLILLMLVLTSSHLKLCAV